MKRLQKTASRCSRLRQIPFAGSHAALFFIFALISSAIFGCRSSRPELDLPKGATVLHIADNDDVPTLDPALGYDTVSWSFEQMIFDTLVRYSDGGVNLVPDVATTWQQSNDARVFTLHLRKDVYFTNGRQVTSTDFKYAIERVLNPATRSQGSEYFRSIAGAEDFVAGRAKSVSGIETADPWTITFHLTAPDPIFIDKLAMPFASAVPREEVQKWGEDFSRHVVGSGPFMLKQWIGGQRLVLVKNPHYFVKGRPRVDAVVETMGVSDELRWLRFEAGELDISSIPPAEFPYVMKTAKLKALTQKIVTLATQYLGMNCQMPPFNDVRVRRAFNYAINKRKLIQLLNGRGVIARGVLPPGIPGYDSTLKGYPYNPAKARRLLEDANLSTNFKPVLWMSSSHAQAGCVAPIARSGPPAAYSAIVQFWLGG
jgi:ABC-type transport system substrate-binding protein